MDETWSVNDPKNGRTTNDIDEKAKLGKSSKLRYNCCRKPLFPFIPLEQVVKDSLHLFLRIADVLINLLTRDLRTADGINAGRNSGQESGKNVDKYIQFLNEIVKYDSGGLWIKSQNTQMARS